MMLIATSALGVDAGAMFLEKRKLQGIADAAALAAASDPVAARAAAERVVAANGDTSVSIDDLATGTYIADPDIVSANRFAPGSTGANAVKIEIRGSIPTFFGRALTGKTTTPIVARATAARINLAAFSLGSGVAAVDGGLANALLSGLAGTDLKLTAIDYNGLATTHIDLLRVTEALRASLDLGDASFGEGAGERGAAAAGRNGDRRRDCRSGNRDSASPDRYAIADAGRAPGGRDRPWPAWQRREIRCDAADRGRHALDAARTARDRPRRSSNNDRSRAFDSWPSLDTRDRRDRRPAVAFAPGLRSVLRVTRYFIPRRRAC